MTNFEKSVQFDLEIADGGRRLTCIARDAIAGSPESLLTETLFKVFEFLTAAESLDPASSAVLDIRVGDWNDPAVSAVAEAFVEAVRGVLQSWVLERRSASCPMNLVVSHERQTDDRNRTIEYLLGDGGGFSRGSTIDLREAS